MRKRQRKESGLEVSGGDAIVAVKLHVIERGGDSIPSGHGRGFVALHVSFGGENHVAVAHRLVDENNFDLERSSNSERSRAEEVHSCRADVAGDKRDRRFLGDIVDAPQS